MSLITDATITVHYARKELLALLDQPIPSDTHRQQSFRKIDTEAAGGTKAFCSDLYAAAFNYVSTYELEEWFCSLPWHEVDCVVLTACGENQDLLTITVFGGRTVVTQSEMINVYTDTYRLVTTENPPSPSVTQDGSLCAHPEDQVCSSLYCSCGCPKCAPRLYAGGQP